MEGEAAVPPANRRYFQATNGGNPACRSSVGLSFEESRQASFLPLLLNDIANTLPPYISRQHNCLVPFLNSINRQRRAISLSRVMLTDPFEATLMAGPAALDDPKMD